MSIREVIRKGIKTIDRLTDYFHNKKQLHPEQYFGMQMTWKRVPMQIVYNFVTSLMNVFHDFINLYI